MVIRLNGMFEFVLWDSTSRCLFLARYYAGMKPLYYCQPEPNTLCFASEIKALLLCQEQAVVDTSAISDFLTLGYLPAERTMFEGISKLRPGQILSIEESGLRKWSFHQFDVRANRRTSDSEFAALLVKGLTDATDQWLMSDVPLGAYISGGVDSSVMAALASRKLGHEMKTYTAWFGPNFPHELANASLVATYLASDHSAVLVDESEVIQNLPRIAWFYDEPISDAAIIPTFFVSRAAARDVKVVIAGEGADELFGGYYQQKLLQFSGKLYGHECAEPPHAAQRYGGFIRRKVGCVALPDYSLPERYIDLHAVFFPDQVRKLAPAVVKGAALSEISTVLCGREGTALNRILLCDTLTRMAESYMMKADKGSMANSVEERSPYLDKRLMTLAFSIPDHLKVTLASDKVLLRRAASYMLPKSIARRRKRGYRVPVDGWIRREIGDFMRNEIEMSDTIKENLDKEALLRVVENRFARPFQFWILGSLALWDHVHCMATSNIQSAAA